MTETNYEQVDYSLFEPFLQSLPMAEQKYDIEKLRDAYAYAFLLHKDQYRNSGEPYITHPIAVAEICASLGLDTDSLCAAFLHDTVEDCSDRTDIPAIEKWFGPQVAMLVDGLTKIVQMEVEDKEEAHIENLRKMLLAMAKDIRVIFIKLCDRLHNMRTLGAKPEDKRRVTALETMYVYAPLAHRLGMQRIKQELENLALSYLDPIGYTEVKADIERKYGTNQGFIESAKDYVSRHLEENHISFKLEGRVKSVYSIYKKMYNQNKSFDEIYDFYALRILVETELECYTVLGIIHDIYNSMPGRFKDYISTPKPNMYRSLHTTVIGRDGIPLEVQIRTYEMHRIAEYGVAAHWKYKTGEKSSKEIDEKLAWVAKLIETEDDTRDPDEFMDALKVDIFQDEIFVFTPKGDVISLPQGATIIDFAYSIHSEVGNRMIGGKVNGIIAPIDRKLQNGEIVQILTSSNARGPSRDWLKIVKTSEARNKIRQWFKREKRTENIQVGKAEIDRELKKFGRSYTDAERNEIMALLATRSGMSDADDVYAAIGYGGLSITKLSVRLREVFDKIVPPEEAEPEPAEPVIQPAKSGKHVGSGVIVDGVTGCQVKFAKCCNPVPGDKIIGFITKGFGISIHKTDCPNVSAGRFREENLDRWIEVQWDSAVHIGDSPESLYEVMLQIFAEDRIGMIAEITSALADMRVSINQLNAQKKPNGKTLILCSVGCKNLDHCQSIVSKLRSVSGIDSVTRAFTS